MGGTTTTQPAAPRATAQQRYQPWTAAGTLAPGLTVGGTVDGGTCWTSSIGDSQNPDAWRCMSGNGILDPCFAPPGGTDVAQVACATSPTSDLTLLDLTTPLASSTASPGGAALVLPWVMVLANGDQCTVFQGTAAEADGIVLSYACADGDATYPDTTSEPWTVEYAPGGTGALQTEAVVTAWQ